eukprot:1004837-Rhodomonas_salina.3
MLFLGLISAFERLLYLHRSPQVVRTPDHLHTLAQYRTSRRPIATHASSGPGVTRRQIAPYTMPVPDIA